MAYEAFRKDGGPTLYPSNKTPVTADVTEWGFIYAAIILAISLLVILPGARGKSVCMCLFIPSTVCGCPF